MGDSDSRNPDGTVVMDDGCVCPAKVVKQKKTCEFKFQTCPYDPRFPQTNTTKRCFFSFVDYQRCARLLGDYPGCLYFLRCYRSLCPISWVDKWFDQMERGTFPRKIYPPKPIIRPEFNPCDSEAVDEDPPFDVKPTC